MEIVLGFFGGREWFGLGFFVCFWFLFVLLLLVVVLLAGKWGLMLPWDLPYLGVFKTP